MPGRDPAEDAVVVRGRAEARAEKFPDVTPTSRTETLNIRLK